MLRIIVAIAVILSAIDGPTAAAQKAPAKKGALYGWVVVIDPGHGGADPGSNGIFEGKRVVEAAYTYDIALRVARMVRQQGGIPLLTIIDGKKEQNVEASKVFPFDGSAVYAVDKKSRVRAGTFGLLRRLALGDQVLNNKQYSKHKKAWISIHFDVVGQNKDIQGVRIITPPGSPDLRLAKSLERSFGDAHRLRAEDPVIASGDRDHGLRRLYILSSRNHLTQRVLIELGNFNNKTDIYRIRAANVRDAWATAIVHGLVQF